MASDEPAEEPSVFDYLYVDHLRMASYVSQLPDALHGHLESVTHDLGFDERTDKKVEGDIKIAKAGRQTTHGHSGRLSKTYNPRWTLAPDYLDALEEYGFIHRGIASAELGQVVLLEGGVTVQDNRLMQTLWEPLLAALAPEFEIPTPGRGVKPGVIKDRQAAMRKFIARFLQLMPHSVAALLRSDEGTAWCTLEPDLMITPPESIVLGRGVVLPGAWHALVVLDAKPGPSEESGIAGAIAEGIELAVSALREQLGRPQDAYAVTPLMIFRKLVRREDALAEAT